MTARDFGVEDDPYKAAEEEAARYRKLSSVERYSHFLDVMHFADLCVRTIPIERLRRAWRALDEVDDPGRWWQRVPSP